MTALLGKSGRGRTVAAMPRSSHPFLVPMSCTVGAQQKRGSGGKELPYWQALFLISTALKSYAIPFCFLGTVIVNEKQYCNISSYNQILIPQDSLKRKKMYLWLREAVNLCSYDCARLHSSCKMGVLSPSSFQRSTPSRLSRLGPGAGFMSTLVKIHWTRFLQQPLKPASSILASWGSG